MVGKVTFNVLKCLLCPTERNFISVLNKFDILRISFFMMCAKLMIGMLSIEKILLLLQEFARCRIVKRNCWKKVAMLRGEK